MLSHYVTCYLIMSHAISLCHMLSHYVTCYLIMSHAISLCHMLSHYVTCYLIMSHAISLCHMLSHYVAWNRFEDVSVALPASISIQSLRLVSERQFFCVSRHTMIDRVIREAWVSSAETML